MEKVTNGFELSMTGTNSVGQAFMDAIFQMSEKSALGKKIHELTYITVLVSTKMYGGLPFHVHRATELGASRDEIKNAMLVSMPIVGIQVADTLPYLTEMMEEQTSREIRRSGSSGKLTHCQKTIQKNGILSSTIIRQRKDAVFV